MDTEALYDLVADAVREALDEREGGPEVRLSRRLVEGRVMFVDADGKTLKDVPVQTLFRKVTSVRERLRVLEQKINNNGGLTERDVAELQGYITRCYGSLTTFNFLFRDEADRFKGTGG